MIEACVSCGRYCHMIEWSSTKAAFAGRAASLRRRKAEASAFSSKKGCCRASAIAPSSRCSRAVWSGQT
jgi:hypothetical protein